ncbi:MAG: hypothetical protein WBA17_06775 [Saprospiraceae bacterium]
MIRHALLSLVGLLFFSAALSAQTVDQAYLYSYLSPFGTARFAGTAGALTPLGSDLTTAVTNPAGLAWVRTSYATVSPVFDMSRVDATLADARELGGNDLPENQFGFASLGFVVAGTTRSVNWPQLNFAISLNRMADFNESYNYQGRNQGSIVQAFTDDANEGFFNDYTNIPFLDAEAIFDDPDNSGVFLSDFDTNPTGEIYRDQTVTRTGGVSELDFSMAGNYRDRLMWGFTLGIPLINFTENRTYREIDDQDQIEFFDNLEYRERLTSTGAGVNFRLGLIYRVSQPVRISAAIHSPSFYSISDEFSTDADYQFTVDGTPTVGNGFSPAGAFDYNLRTPWRYNFGVGILAGKKGFISIDGDYANYATNTVSFENLDDDAAVFNDGIRNSLDGVFSARVGGELNMNPVMVRAGAQVRRSAFRGDEETYPLLSAGAGYRIKKFAVDLAYQYETQAQVFRPYQAFPPVVEQTVATDFTTHRILLSLSLAF